MGSRVRVVLFVLGVALGSFGTDVRAEAPSGSASSARVRLNLHDCPRAQSALVRKLVHIELHAEVVDDPSADLTAVYVRCADDKAEVVVDDPLTGKRLSRRYDTSRTEPEVFSRTLGLAIVELVAASWTELELDSRAEALPVDERMAPDASRSAAREALRRTRGEPRRRWRVGASAQVRSGAETALLGGGILVAYDVVPWLAGVIDVGLVAGRRGTALGDVSVRVMDGAFVACFGRNGPRLGACLGPGLRAGLVFLRGHARAGVEGGTVTGAYVAPLLFGSARLRIGARWGMMLTAELGYAVNDVEGGRIEGRGPLTLGPILGGGGLFVHLEL